MAGVKASPFLSCRQRGNKKKYKNTTVPVKIIRIIYVENCTNIWAKVILFANCCANCYHNFNLCGFSIKWRHFLRCSTKADVVRDLSHTYEECGKVCGHSEERVNKFLISNANPLQGFGFHSHCNKRQTKRQRVIFKLTSPHWTKTT